MATQKINIPSPAIFQTDPEEQIYAKGTLDRDMSGFAYMFKNAAETRRQQDQGTYLQGVSEANRMAAALAKQENAQAMLIEAMKLVPDYAKAGVPIAQFPTLASTSSTGGTDDQTANASLLVNLLKQSEITKNNAQAVAAGREGGPAGPEYTEESQITPSGQSITTMRMKQKGGDSAVAKEILRQRVLQELNARGIKGSGPGGTGLPQANPVDVSRTQEYNRGRWGGQ